MRLIPALTFALLKLLLGGSTKGLVLEGLSKGVGGGGLEIGTVTLLDVGGEETVFEVVLLFLLKDSYILYNEKTETVVGTGNSVFSSKGAGY